MDGFGIQSTTAFRSLLKNDQAALGAKWAPGFSPAGSGQAAITAITALMPSLNVTTLATWEVHECNVGDQPQWLFDAVTAFLDAP